MGSLAGLAGFIDRRRGRLLLAAGAWVVAAAVLGGPVAGRLTSASTNFEDASSPSVAARDQLERATGANPEAGVVALLPVVGTVGSPATRARIAAVAAALRGDPAVAGIASYASTGSRAFVSRDGRLTFLAATLVPIPANREKQVAERIEQRLAAVPGVTVGGPLVATAQVNKQVERDLVRAELVVFPLLFVLALLIFGGAVAALLPLVGGLVVIVSTLLCLRIVNGFAPLSIYAVNLTTGLGLGLSIDYSLFVLSRYREELAVDGDRHRALRATLDSAGRTVLYSSVTVAVAVAALFVFPQPFLYSMGVGGVAAALFSGLYGVVVLPAILALLGPRVNMLAPGPLRRLATAGRSRFWYRLSHLVMRRAGLVAAAAAALLLALGAPFLGIRFTGIDASVLPPSASARQVNDALESRFAANETSPAYVAVSAPAAARGPVESLAAGLRGLPGVASVRPPRLVGGSTWRIDVVPRQAALAGETTRLVERMRALPTPLATRVGGTTAGFLDLQASLRSKLPLAIAVLAGATLIVLFLMTGSLVLPLKSLLMNVLSLSATFGLLVLIFQDGRLEGVLRYTSQGALESTQPILLAVIAFALSTDYAVFLLTRIKEARDAGAGNTEAVARGLERSGRIVTSAALLFCVAVLAFSTSKIVFIKELGVGMALAVIIDATIVRALLVPSLMKLLGDWNWWAPRPLRRLHERLALEERPSPAVDR